METSRARNPLRGLLVAAIALAGVLIARPSSAMLSCDTKTIQDTAPTGTTITSAAIVTSPVTYCDVKGTIATSSDGQTNTVLFELGLPNTWSGDFVFIGNGGFAGSVQAVDEGEFIAAVSEGLATAATDTGHESALGPLGLSMAALA